MRQEKLYQLERIAGKVHRLIESGDLAGVAEQFLSYLGKRPAETLRKVLCSYFETWAFMVEIPVDQVGAVWKFVLKVGDRES